MNPSSSHRIELIPLEGFPQVAAGEDLAALLVDSLVANGIALQAHDVLVLAQKIFSKAENRFVDLGAVEPGPEALALAPTVLKDARLVEVILRESVRVVRARPHVLIVEDRRGFVMANAGLDQSNVGVASAGTDPDLGWALLLPEDPDASAAAIRQRLQQRFGVPLAVVINDSFGRAWRRGTVGVALGAAGLPSLLDLRGQPDLYGRTLRTSEQAFADEIAAAASLVMGQADEGRPAVLVRGLKWRAEENPAATLIRAAKDDLFR